ncbi:MAG: hypothetical protein L0206_09330 [Actinobacteria bacterium]|nr:hypothetical protein [Actinomycetota bacterium]
MTDFEDYEGQFYGLGAFDMSSENAFVDEGFGVPATGHDGIGAGIVATLVERARSSPYKRWAATRTSTRR